MNEALLFLAMFLAQGLVLLVVSMGIYALLLRRSAATQHFLWRTTMAALLALPTLSALPPVWQLPMFTNSMAMADDTLTSAWEIPIRELSPLILAEPLAQVTEEAPFVLTSHWPVALLGIWAVGCLWIIGQFAIGYLKLTQLQRRCQPLQVASAWIDAVEEQRQILGIRQSVRLKAGDDVRVPLIFGIFRPCLLLPLDVLEADPNDRAMILRHELAHVKRRDGLFQCLRCLATAAHWPNPLTWIAARRLRLSEERAVDDLVLSSGHRPIHYAELLSRFAAGPSLANTAPLHAMAQASTVRTRITCVLNAEQERRVPHWFFKSALVSFLTLAVLVLGSLQAEPPSESDSWVTNVFVVDPGRWQVAVQELDDHTLPAEALLAKAGITLPQNSRAIYDDELSRVIARSPSDIAEKIKTFFASEFGAYPRSALQVKVTCRLVKAKNGTIRAFLEQDEAFDNLDGPATIRGVLTEPQLQVVLKSLKKDSNVEFLAMPTVVTRSGQTASIQIGSPDDTFYMSVLPNVDGEEQLVELEMSFDPPEIERKATTLVTLNNQSTVVVGIGKGQFAFISARIIRPSAKVTTNSVEKPRKPKTSSIRTVVIDPGHGGADLGVKTEGANEKDLVLEFARNLRRELEDRGYEVILTRQTDRHVTLQQRSEIANALEDAVFVSVHFNGSSNGSARGFETYYPAAKDGESPRERSEALAGEVQSTISVATGNHALNRGIRQSNFKILQETKAPAIIVEGAFLTNPEDLALAQDKIFRSKLATGIANGIVAFDRSPN